MDETVEKESERKKRKRKRGEEDGNRLIVFNLLSIETELFCAVYMMREREMVEGGWLLKKRDRDREIERDRERDGEVGRRSSAVGYPLPVAYHIFPHSSHFSPGHVMFAQLREKNLAPTHTKQPRSIGYIPLYISIYTHIQPFIHQGMGV